MKANSESGVIRRPGSKLVTLFRSGKDAASPGMARLRGGISALEAALRGVFRGNPERRDWEEDGVSGHRDGG